MFQTAVIGEERHIMRDRHDLPIKHLLGTSNLFIGDPTIRCNYLLET